MIFSAVFYQVSLEGHQTIYIYVLDPFHLQRVSKLYRKYKPVRITQKEHLLIWNSKATQKPKHLRKPKLPNRNSYFSSYKAWKNTYDMQLFTFFHIENTSKQQKNAGFYEYGANAFEAVQKISTRTLLELRQLSKTANFKATHMKKHI